MSKWAGIMLVHHSQLITEIENIRLYLGFTNCDIFILDAKFKRFAKGALTHLNLELEIIYPELVSVMTPRDFAILKHQHQELKMTCEATMESISSLKISIGNKILDLDSKVVIYGVLAEIEGLVSTENVQYENIILNWPKN